MDARFILLLKEQGPLLKDDPKAKETLENEVTSVFIKTGLHRSMDSERFTQEVTVYANLLLTDITADPKYAALKTAEINYIFTNGLKGRLNNDKDIVITYKTFLRWMEGYINHEEYAAAKLKMMEAKYAAAPKLPPKKEEQPRTLSDEEMMKIIEESYQEYREYRRRTDTTKETSGPKSIRQIVFRNLPFSCKDYGSMKIKFLRIKGKTQSSELFEEFEKAYNQGQVNYFEHAI